MKMNLSKEVPTKIKKVLKSFVVNLLAGTPYDLADVSKNALFAVHPGGPSIIEAVGDLLELESEQLAASHQVLLERGNMSSALDSAISRVSMVLQVP